MINKGVDNVNSYKDAILPIAEIYDINGCITEKDISGVMYNLDIPFSEVEFIFEILDKFGIQIKEPDELTNAFDSCENELTRSNCIEKNSEKYEIRGDDSAVQDVLYFSASGCSGIGKMVGKNKFILYKGAKVSKELFASGRNEIKKTRLFYDDVIKDYETIQDISFKSASGAAKFICGYSINGKTAWKNKQGITLKQLLEK